jgi:hypothetical protein
MAGQKCKNNITRKEELGKGVAGYIYYSSLWVNLQH